MGKSIREVYGTVLAELGDTNENIVVLDADLSGSTKSGIFGKAHPERHFNMGIAESDMVATAAGLATTGKIPFVNTFTVFLTTLGLISARPLPASRPSRCLCQQALPSRASWMCPPVHGTLMPWNTLLPTVSWTASANDVLRRMTRSRAPCS